MIYITGLALVGTSALMLFEGVGASIHSFFVKLSQIHTKSIKIIGKIAIPWQKLKSSTHSLKFLKRALYNEWVMNFEAS